MFTDERKQIYQTVDTVTIDQSSFSSNTVNRGDIFKIEFSAKYENSQFRKNKMMFLNYFLNESAIVYILSNFAISNTNFLNNTANNGGDIDLVSYILNFYKHLLQGIMDMVISQIANLITITAVSVLYFPADLPF